MKFSQAITALDEPPNPNWTNLGLSYKTPTGELVFIPMEDFKSRDCWAIQFQSTDPEFNQACRELHAELSGANSLETTKTQRDTKH